MMISENNESIQAPSTINIGWSASPEERATLASISNNEEMTVDCDALVSNVEDNSQLAAILQDDTGAGASPPSMLAEQAVLNHENKCGHSSVVSISQFVANLPPTRKASFFFFVFMFLGSLGLSSVGLGLCFRGRKRDLAPGNFVNRLKGGIYRSNINNLNSTAMPHGANDKTNDDDEGLISISENDEQDLPIEFPPTSVIPLLMSTESWFDPDEGNFTTGLPKESFSNSTTSATASLAPEVASTTNSVSIIECTQDPCFVDLSSDFVFEYQVKVPDDTTIEICAGCAIHVKVSYYGIAWLGVGFSLDGGMIGSEVVIGVPEDGEKQLPQKFNLLANSIDSIQPMSAEHQTLSDSSIEVVMSDDGTKSTIMKFTKIMKEDDEIEITTAENKFIWAHGFSESLGYHADKSSFSLNLLRPLYNLESAPPSTLDASKPVQAQFGGSDEDNAASTAGDAEAANMITSTTGTMTTDASDIIGIESTEIIQTTDQLATNQVNQSSTLAFTAGEHSSTNASNAIANTEILVSNDINSNKPPADQLASTPVIETGFDALTASNVSNLTDSMSPSDQLATNQVLESGGIALSAGETPSTNTSTGATTAIMGIIASNSSNLTHPKPLPVQLTPVQVIESNKTVTNTPTYYPTAFTTLITNVFTPVADTFVEYNSSSSFGSRNRLKVDGQPQRITLIRFDMTSLALNKAAEIFSAKLRLYALDNSDFGGDIHILMEDLCGQWYEELTWSAAPPGVFSNAALIGAFGRVQRNKWHEADLELELNDLPIDFTIRISSQEDNGATYASKEYASAVPQLVVEYFGTPSENSSTALLPFSKLPSSAPVKPTNSPTSSPIESVVIEVTKDAMLRSGKYSNSIFGFDPYIAMKVSNSPDREAKSILGFDLSSIAQLIEYTFELKIFITFADSDDESRTLTVYQLNENFEWKEESITWSRLGSPTMQSISSFNIVQSTIGSYIGVPLGKLERVNDKINLVIEITSDSSEGSKFDFASRQNDSNPPILIATPTAG